MTRSHIIGAYRSPVAPRNGALSAYQPFDLAASVIAKLMKETGIRKDQVEELVLANALGANGNQARITALAAGLPQHVAGLSIDRQCAGGLDAVVLADALIRSGMKDVVIAGGSESYSRRPIRMHTFADGTPPQAYEQAPFTPWADRDPDMAEAADQLAQKLKIDRAEQDSWAQKSHAKTLKAQASLRREIVPMAGLSDDAFARPLTDRHCALAKQVCGTITAANMAVAADGAAFVLMVSDRILRKLTCPSVAVIAGKTMGADPVQPGLAANPAVEATLADARLSATGLSCAEIMEAFAVQAIACQSGTGVPREIVNQKGGALARGHPIGASGAILAVRLFHDLTAAKGGTGLAAIAAAGGLGTALLLSR
ncbi:thiolase family protein [uncultured Litoreibacter sp.]|uniref:thiolase family protein n=1 Tax=uncultured Litoreibacter sp. TaxID=1392394 RepID=UPI002629A62F|nr:thiolase family protein [uncultured Litoreibacter sp.]